MVTAFGFSRRVFDDYLWSFLLNNNGCLRLIGFTHDLSLRRVDVRVVVRVLFVGCFSFSAAQTEGGDPLS
jgi:hypothetical protein